MARAKKVTRKPVKVVSNGTAATPKLKLTALQRSTLKILNDAGASGVIEWKKTPTKTLSALSEIGLAKSKKVRGHERPIWFVTARGAKILDAAA